MADDEKPDKPGPPPAIPGESYDAEQWQRYQRFQEFQKFEEAQRHGNDPPAAPSPVNRGKPWWHGLLASKWVRRLVVLIVLLLAANWAINHYFGDPDEDLPASETGGFKETRSVIQARSPEEGLKLFYLGVAEGGVQRAQEYTCNRFETEELAERFADHMNAPTCHLAVQSLGEMVTDTSAFAETMPTAAEMTRKPDGSVVVSSCAIDVRGGPRLGEFTFRVIPNSVERQWIITDHRKEASDCR